MMTATHTQALNVFYDLAKNPPADVVGMNFVTRAAITSVVMRNAAIKNPEWEQVATRFDSRLEKDDGMSRDALLDCSMLILKAYSEKTLKPATYNYLRNVTDAVNATNLVPDPSISRLEGPSANKTRPIVSPIPIPTRPPNESLESLLESTRKHPSAFLEFLFIVGSILVSMLIFWVCNKKL